ncbi:MGMT family protein [Candidatus Woesearchaeota archaeon]|nr:MGMT family protein [Candidatus Woesearchaeota archaeon]
MKNKTFSEKVYSLVKRIPRGRVSTYKEIAIALNKKAYRAVGNALNKNPYSPIVACHRVIKSSGEIGGFATGAENKIKLLKKEGIKVKNNKIENFEDVLFRF